jgi:predicted transposase YdaD
MGRFDASAKRAIHLYARAWVEWLLEPQQVEIEAESSVEFEFVGRRTDVLLRVRDEAAGRYLVLIELQTRYDPAMSRRLAAYAALAREKYELDVYVIVVYLIPPPNEVDLARGFYSQWMGQTAQQDFEVIGLWELEADAAVALNNPVLLPFVPLMRGGATVERVRTCVDLLRQEPAAEELQALLGAFASLVMDVEVVRQITRWSMQIIKDSPLYRDLVMDLEQARAEARAEGHAEGHAEGREIAVNVLRRFIAFRFNVAEDYFDADFAVLDLAAIKQLNDAVVDADDLDDFTERLAQVKRQVEESRHGDPPLA